MHDGRSQGDRRDRGPCGHAGAGEGRRRPGGRGLLTHPTAPPRRRPRSARRTPLRAVREGGPHRTALRGGRTGRRQPPPRLRQYLCGGRRDRVPARHRRAPTRREVGGVGPGADVADPPRAAGDDARARTGHPQRATGGPAAPAIGGPALSAVDAPAPPAVDTPPPSTAEAPENPAAVPPPSTAAAAEHAADDRRPATGARRRPAAPHRRSGR